MGVTLEHPLLRFLNKDRGPIVKITTARREIERGGPFFYSTARLSSTIADGFRDGDVLAFGGGGWSLDRQVSQEKAIVEAVERWAFLHYLHHSPEIAGLQFDSTSNGFAAIPKAFGMNFAMDHAFCEATERFLLNRFWLSRDLALERIPIETASLEVRSLMKTQNASFELWRTTLDGSSPVTPNRGPLTFVLALGWRSSGGVVPGSACGHGLVEVTDRAILEAITHVNAVRRIEEGSIAVGETVTDRRLVFFANNGESVREALAECSKSNQAAPRPKVLIAAALPGPWEPEVLVTRVVVADSPPIIEGDEKRFLI